MCGKSCATSKKLIKANEKISFLERALTQAKMQATAEAKHAISLQNTIYELNDEIGTLNEQLVIAQKEIIINHYAEQLNKAKDYRNKKKAIDFAMYDKRKEFNNEEL